MKIIEVVESVKMSIESLKANKIRSMLASLGVVIGISIVIMMGWLIGAMDSVMDDTFNMLGTDMLYVDKWDWTGGKSWRDLENRKDFTIELANKLKEQHKSAEFVIPNLNKWGMRITYNGEDFQGVSLIGTSYENSFTPAGEVIQGRYFNSTEDFVGDNVVVLGYKVFTTIFPDSNAVGQTIKIKGRKMQVVGVIKKRGTMFFDMIDNQVFIPTKTFLAMNGLNFRSMNIAVKAGSEDKMDEVRDETRGLMRTLRGIAPDKEDDFSINETKAFQGSMEKIRQVIWGVGIGMTMLSFIVGIIGIMNIMFVSVAERTKEIGIRKALGAKKSSIWTQFLVEAGVLCFVGALISFIICSILVFAAATILPKFSPSWAFLSPVLPYDMLIIASVVSVVVGMLAGLIPAIRAANLNVVDALRYE